nr:MAG TPA: hypothetical protein [Caudoviricetes sp.]
MKIFFLDYEKKQKKKKKNFEDQELSLHLKSINSRLAFL